MSFFTPLSNTPSSSVINFLSPCLKVIFGIFLLVIRIRSGQKTLNQTVLSFFSSSTRAPFQKTPRFSSSSLLSHVSKSVLAKNFEMDGNLRAFDHIPASAVFIFP